jgi:hypothetical protein
MRHLLAVFILSLSAVFVIGCAGNTTTSPSSTTSSTGDSTITFMGLAVAGVCSVIDRSTPSCAVSTYTESGFKVSTISGNWFVRTDYGNPAPFILFSAPAGGSGAIQVAAAGGTFGFKSVDLYASVIPIPYTITGLRNSAATFTVANTVPNPFGAFTTVVNPQAAEMIDTLVISLSNPSAVETPMGLDNIVLTH